MHLPGTHPEPEPRPATKPAARARRTKPNLSNAQVIRQLVKLVQTQRSSRSTVQIDRGPRGQVLISVSVHQGDEPGLTTVAAVAARARSIFDELCSDYPISGLSGDGDNGKT